MKPEYIVIVVEDAHRANVISATFANDQQEVDSITREWNDGYHYCIVLSCDYSLRGE